MKDLEKLCEAVAKLTGKKPFSGLECSFYTTDEDAIESATKLINESKMERGIINLIYGSF